MQRLQTHVDLRPLVVCAALLTAALVGTTRTSNAQMIFRVDSTTSGVTMDVTVDTGGFGSDSDSDSTGLGGTIIAAVDESTIQLTTVTLRLVDELQFGFDFGLVGSVDATASPSALTLEMLEEGPPADLENGSFTQENNVVALRGTLDLEVDGVLGTVFEGGPQDIDIPSLMSFSGTVSEQDGEEVLVLAIDFTGEFDLGGGATADVALQGTVRAVGAGFVADETPPDLPATTVAGSVFPTPAHQSATLELAVARTEHVRVEIYDVQGRRLSLPVDRVLPAGTHEVSIDVSSLGNGVYMAVVTGETVRTSVPVLVAR